MLVGGDNQITPPRWTNAYAAALRDRGISVDVTIAPGLAYNILLEPVTMYRLKQIVSMFSTAR